MQRVAFFNFWSEFRLRNDPDTRFPADPDRRGVECHTERKPLKAESGAGSRQILYDVQKILHAVDNKICPGIIPGLRKPVPVTVRTLCGYQVFCRVQYPSADCHR